MMMAIVVLNERCLENYRDGSERIEWVLIVNSGSPECKMLEAAQMRGRGQVLNGGQLRALRTLRRVKLIRVKRSRAGGRVK